MKEVYMVATNSKNLCSVNCTDLVAVSSCRSTWGLVFSRFFHAVIVLLALIVGSPLAMADAVDMFLIAENASGVRTKMASAGRQAVRFNRELARMPLQSKARFSLTCSVSYELIYDNRYDHPSGNVTWSGYLKDYGNDYRAVITFGEGGVSGRILTPEGEFLVESDADGEWLIDTQAAGQIADGPSIDDALIPSLVEQIDKHLSEEKSGDTDATDAAESNVMAAAATKTTIDVMILYTPGLANRLGSGLSTRLDQLVALANQAYVDSGININLRLVHKEQVNYNDSTSNSDALNALTNGSDSALANVAALRDTYGADLVSLIRPYNKNTAGGCGIGWLNGSGGQSISLFSKYGYSVISDGTDINGTGYYCLDLGFAHELGHNMGSAHDRPNASGQGAYSYSYGYGVAGIFGTVMSYTCLGGAGCPTVAKFSNPNIPCPSGACGISETASNSANNALSLNNTRDGVAGFKPSVIQAGAVRLGVFRSGGLWYLDLGGFGIWDGCSVDRCFSFGLAGDLPVVGDWNGDGRSKIGVHRNGNQWILDYNGNGAWDGCGVDRCWVGFGLPGDRPIAGDWNGDGRAEIGVNRGGYQWYLDYNGNGTWDGCNIDRCFNFGLSGDLPVAGDWNGDGRTEIGVYRNGNQWILDYNGNGAWDGCGVERCWVGFGLPGDRPIAGDWNGDGRAEIGVNRSGYQWYLDHNGNGAWDGCSIDSCLVGFGLLGDLPVIGKWN